jgi:hypothetical protein
MAHAHGDLEEGGILCLGSQDSIATSKAPEGESQKSNTRGPWWFWTCLYLFCVIVVWMCIGYSEVKGTLSTEAKLVQDIAAVVMLVSSCRIVSIMYKCNSMTFPHEECGMAIFLKDVRGALEEGGFFGSADGAANKASQGDSRNNAWRNSKTRGLWWVWLCLFAASGLVVCICLEYSEVTGTLPTACVWLQGIVAVLMMGSHIWLQSIIFLDVTSTKPLSIKMWCWFCPMVVSGWFVQICTMFSYIGTLPTAVLRLVGIAGVVMIVCFFGLHCAMCTARPPHKNDGRGLEMPLQKDSMA